MRVSVSCENCVPNRYEPFLPKRNGKDRSPRFVLHIQRRVVGRMAAFFQLFDESVISARSVPEASSYEPSFGTSRGSRTEFIRAYSANAFLSGHQRVIVSRDYNKAITHMVIRCQACKYLAARSLCSPVSPSLGVRQFQRCFASTFFGLIVC